MTISTCLAVALFLLAGCGRAEAAQCACATEALHVRNGAGTSHAILHTMAVGDCLTYRGDSKAAGGYTWYHLTYNGQSAWAASNWLKLQSCGASKSGCPKIITRAQWGARAPSQAIGHMANLPVYVFIHHGASGAGCFTRANCQQQVKNYQNYHMDGHGWSDIGYNFIVGEDGNVYQGRGWKEIGAHTYGYNSNGIAICLIGDFTSRVPNQAALRAVKQLIQCGLDNKHIAHSYTLKGHRDVGQTACPGTKLYQLIQSWPHYASGTKLFG